MDDTRHAVVICAKRSPVGKAFGAFASVKAEDLLVPVMRGLFYDVALDATEIDDVIIGNAVGGGGNIARLAGLSAGFHIEIPGVSIDRQCGSGLEAINMACRLVQSGAGDIYIAGGVESVSTAPIRAKQPFRSGEKPQFYSRAQFSPDFLGDPDMGEAAENVAKKYNITRQQQDAFALESHKRAVIAENNGCFTNEIVPIQTDQNRIERDECIRHDTSLEQLGRLEPKFDPDGTVTAGNACPLNDGAAVVLVTSLAKAKSLGISKAMLFIDGVTRGVDPNLLGIGPVASTKYLFHRHQGIDINMLRYIEFNEAFASQVLASLNQLHIDPLRVNLEGGALALGHPFGASGALLVTRLLSQSCRSSDVEPGSLLLATLGTAGGMGMSTLFRLLHITS